MKRDKDFSMIKRRVNIRQTQLNTKGCCFLCLTVIDEANADFHNKTSGRRGGATHPLVSLKTLQRCFGISRSIMKNEVPPPPPPVTLDSTAAGAASETQSDIEVELCLPCTKILDKFKDAFLSIEKAQMELNYWSGRVHLQISEGSKKPELVQYYSEVMGSDAETLTQLVFADDLRQEIAKKSLTMRFGSEAKICLNQSGLEKPTAKSTESPDNPSNQDQNLLKHDVNSDDYDDDDDDDDDDISFDREEETHNRHSLTMQDADDYYDEEDVDIPSSSSLIITVKEEALEVAYPSTSLSPPAPLRPPTFPFGSSLLAPITLAAPTPTTEPPAPDQMYVRNSETGAYLCSFCNLQFKSKSTVKPHYEAIHLGKTFPCDKCGRGYTQLYSLRKHKKICKGGINRRQNFSRGAIKNVIFDPGTGKYSCTACAKEYSTAAGVYVHFNAVHLKVRHKCEICNRAEFSNVRSLAKHQETCGTMKTK